ncbi:hypothetical protein B0T17DRAFT_96755 [Bombardia bombarda]|uniref:Uncharacterized protein n=1 Tax=Bombardia bombarda TaxID=252184 RepID=A0AA39XMY7_9PEZI|nr:hypothetical protein B0T17DRAFT_96755 [Bombardia bombarda]
MYLVNVPKVPTYLPFGGGTSATREPACGPSPSSPPASFTWRATLAARLPVFPDLLGRLSTPPQHSPASHLPLRLLPPSLLPVQPEAKFSVAMRQRSGMYQWQWPSDSCRKHGLPKVTYLRYLYLTLTELSVVRLLQWIWIVCTHGQAPAAAPASSERRTVPRGAEASPLLPELGARALCPPSRSPPTTHLHCCPPRSPRLRTPLTLALSLCPPHLPDRRPAKPGQGTYLFAGAPSLCSSTTPETAPFLSAFSLLLSLSCPVLLAHLSSQRDRSFPAISSCLVPSN